MNGHIQTSHSPEGGGFYAYVATVSKSMRKDMQEYRVCCALILPTNDMQPPNLSHQ